MLDSKRDGLFALGRPGVGAFTDMEEVIEGDVGEVRNDLLDLVSCVSFGGVEGSLKEVLDNSDGDGEFGFHFGIGFEERSEGLGEALPGCMVMPVD